MICHRKCVAKCEKSSDCRGILADYAVSEEESIEIATPAVIINPEIIMTDPDNSAVCWFKLVGQVIHKYLTKNNIHVVSIFYM